MKALPVYPAACTTLALWTRDARHNEGLLQRPLRTTPARGPPVSDGQVLDAAREGRARWDLRPGRALDATRGNGRGDPARPRPRLPETRRLRQAHRQGGPAHRFPVVGEDGRALSPRLGRHARSLPRRPRRGLRRLAGGTHHAFSDRGEGYCVFNDSAIAARAVQAAGLVERVVIIDTDVHQGNGTAAILHGETRRCLRSRSTAQRTSPSTKRRATSTRPFPDGAGDTEFLATLESGWRRRSTQRTQTSPSTSQAPTLSRETASAGSPYEVRPRRARPDRPRNLQGTRNPCCGYDGGRLRHEVEDTVDIHFQSIRRAAGLLESAADRPKVTRLT